MKPHRNDPCPCGSGKRYKNCCAHRRRGMSGAAQAALIGGAVCLVGVIVIAMTYRNDQLRRAPVVPARPFAADQSAPQATATSAPVAPMPQPPGEAPPGKVWSPEHGHWHDLVLVPQPAGPVPPGKVWVPEHGHWHDIATGAASPAEPVSGASQNDGQAVPSAGASQGNR